MVCKDAVEDLGAKFERTPIGTGPFMFAEYQPQQYVKLVANDAYFRGAPKIKEIYYRYIPSDASRDLAFQSGAIDMIYGKQDQTWVERIRSEERRVGTEGVSTCRSLWSVYHSHKNSLERIT